MIDISKDLCSLLNKNPRVVVLTGAGISAESGVATFRDAQSGLWQRYRPEDLATPQAFENNPQLVWEWYAWRRELVVKAQPNAGHRALVEFENRCQDFLLVTQNVDGLHHRAGSQRLVELHGNLFRSRCSREQRTFDTWDEINAIPPRCPYCGSLLRPDVVWFGEALPEEALATALTAAENSDLFFSIGTSAIVQPAASLPFVALQHGSIVIEINPEDTPLSSHAHFKLTAPAGEALPALLQAAWGG